MITAQGAKSLVEYSKTKQGALESIQDQILIRAKTNHYELILGFKSELIRIWPKYNEIIFELNNNGFKITNNSEIIEISWR